MPSLGTHNNNHFISSDSLIITHARQRVIEANNGYLVTPVLILHQDCGPSPRLAATYVKSISQPDSSDDES